MKNNPILKFKEFIRSKAEEQRTLKPQRKTVHFEGERTEDPDTATWKHQVNRHVLRHMYIAYGMLRGKSFEQIENNSKTSYDEELVSSYMSKYQPSEEAVRVSA